MKLKGEGKVPFEQCPHTNCFLTRDKSEMKSSDVVLFHASDIPTHPPQKALGQIWGYFNLESPPLTPRVPDSYRKTFNWTLTYRRDSDVPVFYAQVNRKQKQFDSNIGVSHNVTNVAHKPKKLAVWMVSNCNSQSKRAKYVDELKKYIPIDIYGACGDKKCPKDKWGKCMNLIAEQYMFYLAFENGLCQDYVTEKFFKVLRFNTGAVPIVYGAADYGYVSLYFLVMYILFKF